MDARKCPLCGDDFVPEHGQQRRCNKCRAAAGLPPAKKPGYKPASKSGDRLPVGPDTPWTMAEAVFYVANLVDVRKAKSAVALAVELSPHCLEKLLAACRAALDRETAGKKVTSCGSLPANSEVG